MTAYQRRVWIHRDADLARAIVEARRHAMESGFAPAQVSQICTALSELGRNILKYADRGSVALRRVEEGGAVGLEIEALDRGPGIDDIETALRDHVSTGGTLGLGLPGVRRMMDDFEIESTPGRGTRVVVRKWR